MVATGLTAEPVRTASWPHEMHAFCLLQENSSTETSSTSDTMTAPEQESFTAHVPTSETANVVPTDTLSNVDISAANSMESSSAATDDDDDFPSSETGRDKVNQPPNVPTNAAAHVQLPATIKGSHDCSQQLFSNVATITDVPIGRMIIVEIDPKDWHKY